MPKKYNHEIHKLVQRQYKSGTIFYGCILPNCPYFIYEPHIVGKVSLCYRCENPFVITAKSLRSKKLHCEDCTRGRYNKPRPKEVVDIMNQAEDLLDTFNVKQEEIKEDQGEQLNGKTGTDGA